MAEGHSGDYDAPDDERIQHTLIDALGEDDGIHAYESIKSLLAGVWNGAHWCGVMDEREDVPRCHRNPFVSGETFHDELDAHIAESMKDPEYAAAFKAAEERSARLVESECSEGNCVVFTDPLDPDYESGWGPVGCPCQDTPIPPAVPAPSTEEHTHG